MSRKVEFIRPVEVVTGRINKKNKEGQIFRQKIYRDSRGHIIGRAKTEHYIPQKPRDYEKKPMSEAEQKTTSAFRQALTQYQLDKADPERMAYWTERWEKQLRKGDSEATIDPKTGKRRIYPRLDSFIRAILQRQFLQ